MITEVGGWCCPGCRLSKLAKPVADSKKAAKKSCISIEQVNDELQFIKTQLASLSDSLTYNLNKVATNDPSSIPVVQPPSVHPTYAQALKSDNNPKFQPHQPASTALLDKNLRSAMLTAMHTELHSKSKRSCNVVISGLMPSSLSSDGEQVQELCRYQFDLNPKVRSTLRLGNPVAGKAQPLLVNLESSDDVEDLMAVARDLRHSTNQYVRDHIYINRHLTKAESAAKFNESVLRRQKEKEKAAAVQDTTYDDDMENYEPTTADPTNTPSFTSSSFLPIEHQANTPSYSSIPCGQPLVFQISAPTMYPSTSGLLIGSSTNVSSIPPTSVVSIVNQMDAPSFQSTSGAPIINQMYAPSIPSTSSIPILNPMYASSIPSTSGASSIRNVGGAR